MKAGEKNIDKAGRHYWNKTWSQYDLPEVWDVESKDISKFSEVKFFELIASSIKNYQSNNSKVELVEVGCARSRVLPVLAKRLGVAVSGIDYSPNGCEQTRAILEREGVSGNVYCADVFNPPVELKDSFDVVVSFGLVEHFTNTNEIVAALASLLKPGGILITAVPNMHGTIGFFQKLLKRDVFDLHVPLTPSEVNMAHSSAHLEVAVSSYFLSMGFGVVEIGEQNWKSPLWVLKKISTALLVRCSFFAWYLERRFGKHPTSQFFSPFVVCIARRQYSENGMD